MAAFAQDGSDFQARAKAGMLSMEECMASPLESYSSVMPSLIRLKEIYSEPDKYDSDLYNRIISQIHYYYMHTGDIVSAEQILNEAENTLRMREPEPNSKFMRDLLIRRGQTEILLKNYSDALRYLNKAHTYFEEANGFGESYMVMLMNMAIAYQKDGDLLPAKMCLDEARERFEKLNGTSIYDIKDERLLIFTANYG